MTTIYLARKFLTATTTQLEMVQLLKKRNKQEMAETKKSLRKIYKNVIKNCRLCLRPAETNIFNNKAGVNYAEDIKQFLDVEVGHGDGRPQYICVACVSTLRDIAQLKQTAQVSQWRLQQEAALLSKRFYNDFVECNGSIAKRSLSSVKEEIDCHNENDVQWEQYKKTIKTTKNDRGLCHSKVKVKKRARRAIVPCVCEVCGLKLKRRENLKSHMLVHSSAFNFPCEACPYRARTGAALAMHRRRHSGARPFRCPHAACAKAFRSASNLASHRRTHLPPPHACQHCSRSFRFRQILEHHVATQHSNAKPFSCSQCGKSFATRKILLCHERKVHKRPCMRIGTTPSYITAQEHSQKLLQQS
ncbi:zinc finger protein 431 isoform X2 [Bicyclus anynana]|uniref:Zinc finger protein 431 isoform X2 n=1 Tax=Bicyclus anynana TaxID=110368 RepID=A0A6J1NNG2_BICAN|nr:zinc finger protein 431 isoform X2 [Bicyclus anynana]